MVLICSARSAYLLSALSLSKCRFPRLRALLLVVDEAPVVLHEIADVVGHEAEVGAVDQLGDHQVVVEGRRLGLGLERLERRTEHAGRRPILGDRHQVVDSSLREAEVHEIFTEEVLGPTVVQRRLGTGLDVPEEVARGVGPVTVIVVGQRRLEGVRGRRGDRDALPRRSCRRRPGRCGRCPRRLGRRGRGWRLRPGRRGVRSEQSDRQGGQVEYRTHGIGSWREAAITRVRGS